MADTSSHHFSFRALGRKAVLRVFTAAAVLCLWGVCALPLAGDAAVQVVSALSWKAKLATGPSFPPCLAAVDKTRGQLFILQYPGSLVLTRAFAAYVDGQNAAGNPHVIEGVYFVAEAANASPQLGPAEQIALNYPNPVDRLRSKMPLKGVIAGKSTGSAHRNDAGVLLYDGDVRALAKVMQPGMPVVFSQSLEQAPVGPSRATSTAAVLVQRVKDWADAWSSLSTDFFDFYDEEAYEASTESFEAFRTQKVKLFRKHEWIRNDLSEIRVLEGPGYWVTWFGQEYSDPTSCSSGVRRLYWMRDESGVFKIVGMEWVSNLRQPDAQEADYPLLPPRDAHDMPPSPVTGADVQPFMKEGYPLELVRKRQNEHGHFIPPRSFAFPDENDGSSPFPRGIDIRVVQGISQYALRNKSRLDHVEKTLEGAMARPDPKAFLLANRRDFRSPVTPPPKRTRPASAGSSASFGEEEISPYEAYAQELLPKPFAARKGDSPSGQGSAQRTIVPVESAKATGVTPFAPDSPADSGVKSETDTLAQAAVQAGADVQAEPETSSAPGTPAEPDVPAVPDVPAAAELSAVPEGSAERAAPAKGDTPAAPAASAQVAEPAEVAESDQTTEQATEQAAGQVAEQAAEQSAIPATPLAQSAPDAFTQSPTEVSGQSIAEVSGQDTPEVAPVAVSTTPEAKAQPKAPRADLSEARAEITRRIEEWRKAWQSANVDAYMKFYAIDATQGVRGSAKAIRFHKERVWPNFTPATVELSDIALTAENSKVVATMKQRYADSAGKEDYGMKTLTFELRNGVWLITREEWSKLSR